MTSNVQQAGDRLRTVTLGCKVNQYETEFVRQGLLGAGYRDAPNDEPAELCIVNTCTVTNEGDAKSRRMVRRMARRNPHARIVVMGCYAARAPEEIAKLPNVSQVVTDRREIPDLLDRLGVTEIPTGISEFGNRHRAFVKVQDGCLLRCSFCIIPAVRPGMSSRPPEEVVEEVRRLASAGYREVVLTGIHLGHYGVDFNRGRPKSEWIRLPSLLKRLVEIDAPFRIRLSSIEATEVTRELVEVMAAYPDRICPHLHVCVQSGSDAVLRRMRRRWGARRIRDRCRLVQSSLDRPALTTDVIVGFPGETEEDFAATCDLLTEIGFSKIHCFPYSPRRGTPAAELPDQVSPETKSQRVRYVGELASQLRRRYFEQLVGSRLRVLIEGQRDTESDGHQPLVGTACRYAPVRLPGNSGRLGELVDVVGKATDGEAVEAVVVSNGAGDTLASVGAIEVKSTL